MKQTQLIFFFFLITIAGFSQKNNSAIKNTPKNDSLIKKYGLSISKSIATQNPSFLVKNINSAQIYTSIILKDPKNKALHKFNKKFKPLFHKRLQSFPEEISNAVQNGDFYNFVSYHFDERDKTYHLIFRYYTNQYGLDYHDYRILKANTHFYIDDIFVFSTNQKLSESLKLFYLSTVPKKEITSLLKKTEYKPILMLKNFVDAANKNDYKSAYKHITILQKSLQNKDRFTAFLKLEIAASLTEEAYVDTIENILQNFTKSPNTQLVAMQYYYANKEYEAIFKCINLLENFTHDTFLDFEKGNLYFAKKDYESAAVFYKNMLKNYPEFNTPKFSLLVVFDRTQQFDKAVQLCNKIIATTSYTKPQLSTKIKERLSQFSTSNQFKKWNKK